MSRAPRTSVRWWILAAALLLWATTTLVARWPPAVTGGLLVGAALAVLAAGVATRHERTRRHASVAHDTDNRDASST